MKVHFERRKLPSRVVPYQRPDVFGVAQLRVREAAL